MDTKQREILHGQRIAHRAEEIWGWGTAAGQRRARRRQSYLLRGGRFGTGQRVLEIGCGTGVFTTALAHAGAEVMAFDISYDLLHRIRAKEGLRDLCVFVGDAERLPLPAASFDAVVGVSVLHHLDLQRAFAEITRVLRPGGRIVFTEPNMLNPQILLQKNVPVLKRWMGDTPDETAFFRWPLARFLQGHGFTDVRVTPFDFLHPWTPRAMIPSVAVLGETLETIPMVREFAGSLLVTGVRRPSAGS